MTRIAKVLVGTGIVASCFSSGAMATLLDFTDSSAGGTIDNLSPITDATGSGFSGLVDGIGFTITSSSGVNIRENYDGSGLACAASPLACNKDGAGVGSSDELSSVGITLAFDDPVLVNALYFLDLYRGSGVEQATVTIKRDGNADVVDSVVAIEGSGLGGYATKSFGIEADSIEFSAVQLANLKDDRNNDYAFAAADVSAIPREPDQPSFVPVPATGWLVLAGVLGMSVRKRKRLG